MWNFSQPGTPTGACYPTVYVGEYQVPPGFSHEMLWELAYIHHFKTDDTLRACSGLLKTDDQMHHIPSVPHSADRHLAIKKVAQKRHFHHPDHIIHTITGLSID